MDLNSCMSGSDKLTFPLSTPCSLLAPTAWLPQCACLPVRVSGHGDKLSRKQSLLPPLCPMPPASLPGTRHRGREQGVHSGTAWVPILALPLTCCVPRTNDLTSPCLSFLICTMGMVAVPLCSIDERSRSVFAKHFKAGLAHSLA